MEGGGTGGAGSEGQLWVEMSWGRIESGGGGAAEDESQPSLTPLFLLPHSGFPLPSRTLGEAVRPELDKERRYVAPRRGSGARSGVRGPPPKWQDSARAPRPAARARLPLLAQRPPPAGRVGECAGSPGARSRVSAPPAQKRRAKLGHRPETCDGFSLAECKSKSGRSRGLPGFSSLRGPRKGPEDAGLDLVAAAAVAWPLCDLERFRPALPWLLQALTSRSAHPPTSLGETRPPVGCGSCRVGRAPWEWVRPGIRSEGAGRLLSQGGEPAG